MLARVPQKPADPHIQLCAGNSDCCGGCFAEARPKTEIKQAFLTVQEVL